MKRLKLSWKAGTRDKRHLAQNVEDIKLNFFLRFLFLVATVELTMSLLLCIHTDETVQNFGSYEKKDMGWQR
jgi:hypothetical protein